MTTNRGAKPPKPVDIPLQDLSAKAAKVRMRTLKHLSKIPLVIAATSGCFDIIHAGHAWLFHEMRKLVGPQGHVVVLLNDDNYLLRAKGRVIVPQEQRMGLLLALRDVDMVIPFEHDTPCTMISQIEPTYFCKGPEYANINIPERGLAEIYGGKTVFVEGGPDVHTSQIIERIHRAYHATDRPHDVEEFFPHE